MHADARWTGVGARVRAAQDAKTTDTSQERAMGDKGGKKDKDKSKKQSSKKQEQDAKKAQEKQPKRKP